MTQITKVPPKKAVSEKVAFIICPIGSDFSETRRRSDWLLREVINPKLEEFHYKSVRADKIEQSGLISRQVIQHCMSADLIIADLTDDNANVFYEYGIAHHAKRPEITFKLAGQTLPFDLHDMRVISYSPWENTEDLRSKMDSYLKEIQSEKYKVMNPVIRTMDEMEILLQNKDNKEAQAIIDINRRVEKLESERNRKAHSSGGALTWLNAIEKQNALDRSSALKQLAEESASSNKNKSLGDIFAEALAEMDKKK